MCQNDQEYWLEYQEDGEELEYETIDELMEYSVMTDDNF